MKRDLLYILLLSFAFLLVYSQSLFNFFAQDDFIFIQNFSQNSILVDLKNVFGLPTVTHWRPFHNLYFFISGNIFGKEYIGYHFLTIALHLGGSFFIYKIIFRATNNYKAAVSGGILYSVHPAHFVSLFWISGGATIIGFLLLVASFYAYILKKMLLTLTLYISALLASESMIVGLLLFYCLKAINLHGLKPLHLRQLLGFRFLGIKREGKELMDNFLVLTSFITIVFVIVRFVALTPGETFSAYLIELSGKTLDAVKYYLLRIAGFAEVSEDQILSFILLAWLFSIGFLVFKVLSRRKNTWEIFLALITIFVGLFPFILIPQHLSAHYMNISVMGFSTLIALTLKHQRAPLVIMFLVIFVILSFFSVNLTLGNNWVIKRSTLAKVYLARIGSERQGAKLVFDDNTISSSKEAYYSLGGGKAIDFWYAQKKYKTCFVAFEKC